MRPPLLAVLALLACAGCAAPPAAELVLVHGRIATVDPELGEVEALAAADGRILAVGSDAEIAAYVGPRTRVIDLAGRRALPGFVEGHGHFVALGEARQMLDLRGARSWDEIVRRVAVAAGDAPPGAWIRGRGWHQEKWERVPDGAVEGFPTRAALDAAAPDHAVWLEHASGHASLVNARALAAAGIDAASADPPGGEILRAVDGAPTGLLREEADVLVARAWDAALRAAGPEARAAALARAIASADRECLAKGVTSFQDAGSSFETLGALRAAAERGALGVRLWVLVREPNERLRTGLAAALVRGAGDGHLSVGGIKVTLDGALGSRGAWLLAPYADSPQSTGLATADLGELAETARIALAHRVQLAVHAIGDRANRELLDLYERELARAGRLGADHRWRVEHAQHLAPADIPRFARLGVIASMQPVHCTSDAPFVIARLGRERAAQGAYVWRSLIDAGALVSAGTDTPVEDVDPLANFRAAVTRRLADGSTFFPEQRMTRAEALAAMTIGAATAAFEEREKGSLAPGKLADVAVLSQDILSVPEEELGDARVDLTIVGGAVVYERQAAGTP